jgi:hypothetical protein
LLIAVSFRAWKFDIRVALVRSRISKIAVLGNALKTSMRRTLQREQVCLSSVINTSIAFPVAPVRSLRHEVVLFPLYLKS